MDAYKKVLLGTIVSLLAACLFFSFGFQIDVSGGVTKTGGTADVVIDPLKVAADEANAAVAAAQLALEEALAAQAAVLAITGDVAGAEAAAQAAVDEAQKAVDDAILAGADEITLAELQEKLKEAQAAQAAVLAITGDVAGAEAAAQAAVDEAQKALDDAILAAGEANSAYSGVKDLSEEELAELQKAVDEAQKALDDAILAGADEETIAELQEELDKAIAALEGDESGLDGSSFYHVITNSNNGGSFEFDMEGNYTSAGGESVPFTFSAEEGYELVWLRVGNVKVMASDLENLFEFSFDKKNLTIHAHFKKIKDYTPEVTTTEGTGGEDPEGDVPGEESKGKGKENNNGKGNKKDKKPKKNK